MTRKAALAIAGAALALAACTTPERAAAPPPDMGWVASARQISQEVPPRLLAVLQEEIARGGAEGAIDACRDKASALAREASARTGWTVRRVSLRQRNPLAVPDAWERAALEDFDRRAAAKEPAAGLERAEVVIENGRPVQRYMRALPTMELCLNCHGRDERMTPAVKAKLQALYPADRAVGYALGEIRGAITLKRAVAN